jgi:hypothetical protein
VAINQSYILAATKEICTLSPPLPGPAGDRCVAVERELVVNKPKAMKKENKD